MNAPIVMLVSVVLWSFGISAAALLGLMFLDWLEVRRAGLGASGVRPAPLKQSGQGLAAKA